MEETIYYEYQNPHLLLGKTKLNNNGVVGTSIIWPTVTTMCPLGAFVWEPLMRPATPRATRLLAPD